MVLRFRAFLGGSAGLASVRGRPRTREGHSAEARRFDEFDVVLLELRGSLVAATLQGAGVPTPADELALKLGGGHAREGRHPAAIRWALL